MASFYPILSLIIVILLSNYSAGQTLTVEKSLVTLPNVSAGTASVYDGDDDEILDSTLGFYPKDEIFWMDLSPLNVQKK